MSLTLASCGRQITPNRSGSSGGGLPSGYMQIKFNTYQTMDFTNVWYVIALNTSGAAASGTNGMPYAFYGNPQQNWLNYSFEIIVAQLQGQSTPTASLWQFVGEPNPAGGQPIKSAVPINGLSSALLNLNSNCNGAGTQICVTINRNLFSGIASPSPNPSSSASASPSPSPSPSPSGSPSASPSASPTASPSSPPAISGVWYINWFTVTPGNPPQGGQVINAPGIGGASNTQWLPPNGTYDTGTTFDFPWNADPGWTQAQTPAGAAIAGGEVLNSP